MIAIYKSTCIQLLLLVNCCTHTKGVVTISPSPWAAVCNAGDQLEVTCNTTDSFLTWSLTFIDHITRTISSTIRHTDVVEMNSTAFAFSRTSELGTIPLVSELVISSIDWSLNGTKIICMEVSASATRETTTVHIIGESHDYPTSPEVDINSEQFGRDGVLVILDWIKDNALVNINVSSVPTMIDTTIDVISAQLTLTVPYNTPTNISIVATLCGMYNATVIGLSYAKCGTPLISDDSGVIVRGYSDLALEGTNITFSCSAGFSFIGSGASTAQCTKTGQWEPDPRDVKCKAIPDCGPPKMPPDGYVLPYTSTLEGARVIFACRNSSQTLNSLPEYSALCYSNGNWEPDPTEICYIKNKDNSDVLIITIASSVCSLLVISCLAFIVGITCGYYYHKNCKHTAKKDSPENSLRSGYPNIKTLYEDPSDVGRERHRLNHDPWLQENEAYAPLQFKH